MMNSRISQISEYSLKLGVSGNTWWFLQGKKEDTYALAAKYLVGVKEDKNAPGGYVHQGTFVLLDKQRRIRGAYDGTSEEEVGKLIADIKILQQEKDNTTSNK
jgi:protein SCO1